VRRGLNRPEGSPRRASQGNRAGERGGGGSDSTPSPAGIRQVGDDRWGPPVIGCARGRREAGWRRWLSGPAGPHSGVLDWAATREKESGPMALWVVAAAGL
jgi:hypothetical protein